MCLSYSIMHMPTCTLYKVPSLLLPSAILFFPSCLPPSLLSSLLYTFPPPLLSPSLPPSPPPHPLFLPPPTPSSLLPPSLPPSLPPFLPPSLPPCLPPSLRSTVEFAREVSEAKAMENTINRFEETFGGGSHDHHMIPRRGTSSSQGSSGSAPQSLGTSDVSNTLYFYML